MDLLVVMGQLLGFHRRYGPGYWCPEYVEGIPVKKPELVYSWVLGPLREKFVHGGDVLQGVGFLKLPRALRAIDMWPLT